MRRHDGLRLLAGGKVGLKPDGRGAAVRADAKHQRRAGIPMPGLDRVDAMPMRALAAPEQKIDCGRSGTAFDHSRIAERFAEMSAFRMRLEIEQADDVLGSQ